MSPLEWRAIERIITTLTGALLVYLGYRLFIKLPEQTDSQGKFILPGNISIYMSRVGPGAFFALFGTSVAIASFYFSLTIIQPQNLEDPYIFYGEPNKTPTTPKGSVISYFGGSGASLAENRAHVLGDIFELNQLSTSLKEDPHSTGQDKTIQAIIRIKLALMWSVWGANGDWGDYQEFRKWIESGDLQSPPREFREAAEFFNQGLN